MKFTLLLLVLVSPFVLKADPSREGGDACKMLFGMGPSQTRADRVKNFQIQVVQRGHQLEQGLRYFYGLRQIPASQFLKMDLNSITAQIVVLNNQVLDLLVAVHEESPNFSSAAERQNRDQLLGVLRSLFDRQNFSSAVVDRLVKRRLEILAQEKAELEKKTTLGFLPTSGPSSVDSRLRTIGFARAPLQTEGYGRKPIEPKPDFSSGWGMPMKPQSGGAAIKSEEIVQKTASIGFLSNQEIKDVGYDFDISADFDHALFTVRRVQEKPMGFIQGP